MFSFCRASCSYVLPSQRLVQQPLGDQDWSRRGGVIGLRLLWPPAPFRLASTKLVLAPTHPLSSAIVPICPAPPATTITADAAGQSRVGPSGEPFCTVTTWRARPVPLLFIALPLCARCNCDCADGCPAPARCATVCTMPAGTPTTPAFAGVSSSSKSRTKDPSSGSRPPTPSSAASSAYHLGSRGMGGVTFSEREWVQRRRVELRNRFGSQFASDCVVRQCLGGKKAR